NFGLAIFLNDAGGDLINNNVCSNNQDGIYVTLGSGSNSIIGNDCSNNQFVGITIVSHSNSIKGNTALSNGLDLYDNNLNCDTNTWRDNTFVTSFPSQPSCIH